MPREWEPGSTRHRTGHTRTGVTVPSKHRNRLENAATARTPTSSSLRLERPIKCHSRESGNPRPCQSPHPPLDPRLRGDDEPGSAPKLNDIGRTPGRAVAADPPRGFTASRILVSRWGTKPPSRSAMRPAKSSGVRSSRYGPTICRPTGRFCGACGRSARPWPAGEVPSRSQIQAKRSEVGPLGAVDGRCVRPDRLALVVRGSRRPDHRHEQDVDRRETARRASPAAARAASVGAPATVDAVARRSAASADHCGRRRERSRRSTSSSDDPGGERPQQDRPDQPQKESSASRRARSAGTRAVVDVRRRRGGAPRSASVERAPTAASSGICGVVEPGRDPIVAQRRAARAAAARAASRPRCSGSGPARKSSSRSRSSAARASGPATREVDSGASAPGGPGTWPRIGTMP